MRLEAEAQGHLGSQLKHSAIPSAPWQNRRQVAELEASLESERSKAASAVSERASTAGELAAIREQHAAELAAERQHYDRLLEVRRALGHAAMQDCTAAWVCKLPCGILLESASTGQRASPLELSIPSNAGSPRRPGGSREAGSRGGQGGCCPPAEGSRGAGGDTGGQPGGAAGGAGATGGCASWLIYPPCILLDCNATVSPPGDQSAAAECA